MTGLPEPMTPPDCDLRGLQFMPLDVVRLIDSDIFAISTGDEFKAAVALWCKSWLQVPAGSLCDDDRVLSHLSGAGNRWHKVRKIALRGFVKCSDGRLYHPVVCEKANEAWGLRLKHRERSAKGHAARWGAGASPSGASSTSNNDASSMHQACDRHEQKNAEGQGQGQGQEKKEAPLRPPQGGDVDFADWYAGYPHKVGRGQAERAYRAARKKADAGILKTALLRYVRTKPPDRAWCNPATWLNGERWLDEPEQPVPRPRGNGVIGGLIPQHPGAGG